MTPYKLWKGKKPNVSYFHIFSRTCYILNDREYLGKFDSKSDIDVFLGYSNNSKAYRVYNMRTLTVTESVNIMVDDFCDFSEFSCGMLFLASSRKLVKELPQTSLLQHKN